jgi:hypothetical protein
VLRLWFDECVVEIVAAIEDDFCQSCCPAKALVLSVPFVGALKYPFSPCLTPLPTAIFAIGPESHSSEFRRFRFPSWVLAAFVFVTIVFFGLSWPLLSSLVVALVFLWFDTKGKDELEYYRLNKWKR